MKRLLRRMLLKLPSARWIDLVVATLYFYVAHRRFPSKHPVLINDFFFRLKTSKSIDSALRQFVSDKDLVKNFYRGVFLKDVAPRTLVKFRSFKDFDITKVPDRCVIKPAHLSGCIFFDRENGGLSKDGLDVIRNWFETNIYRDVSRERNYRFLTPSVICEEMIASSDDIKDYKVFCYDGSPRFIQVDVGRHTHHRRRLYTPDWSALPYKYNKPLADIESPPSCLTEVLNMATEIARWFNFIRVDFFIVDGRIFMGELTNVPENAHGRFKSVEDERSMMECLVGGNAYKTSPSDEAGP